MQQRGKKHQDIDRSKEFCACGGLNQLPCRGACRKAHSVKGYVKCGEFYRLELPKRRPQRRRPRPSIEDEARQRFNEWRGFDE